MALEQEDLIARSTPPPHPTPRLKRQWDATWPKVAAVVIVLFAWQVVVWTHWRPDYILPGPWTVFRRLGHDLISRDPAGFLPTAMRVTLRRAVVGYGVAFIVGSLLGAAVSRFKPLRAAIGSLITGLQTMPSIAWFPLAILLFGSSETAILFVVVLGAAPAIANGLLTGIDHIAPLLLRAGRVMGARGVSLYRHVVIPAALPSFVGGLKQGWAFAWRSLMAGELLVIIANRPSLGQRLQFAEQNLDAEGLLAAMIIVLLIGIVVDSLVFGPIERTIRRRRGLIESTTP